MIEKEQESTGIKKVSKFLKKDLVVKNFHSYLCARFDREGFTERKNEKKASIILKGFGSVSYLCRPKQNDANQAQKRAVD